MKECVVVLGMHRSGTSVLAGFISLQGYYIGATEMPPQDYNPKGFFENQKIYELNESFIMDNGGSWHDYSFTIDHIKSSDLDNYEAKIKAVIKGEFGTAERIFIKDPRMCLLFPLWEKVLKEMGYNIRIIFSWRSPMEVAHSLKVRDEMAVEKSLMIWSHYFFQGEKNSRNFKRFVVHYDDDFRDLDTFIKKLGDFLEVGLTEEMYQTAYELYTPKLKHHLIELKSITNDLPSYLRGLIAVLMANDIGNKEKLDELNNEFNYSKKYYLYDQAQQKEELEKKSENIRQKQRQLNHLQQKYNECDRELDRSVKQLASITKTSHERDRKINQLEGLLSDAYLVQNEKKREIDTSQRELEAIQHNLIATKQELESRNQQLNITKHDLELVDFRFSNAEQIFQTLFYDRAGYKQLFKYFAGGYSLKNRFLLLFMKKKERELFKDKELIGQSGLFSPLYYLSTYPDVWQSGLDPLMHFCKYGWKEGRQPSAVFDIRAYVKDNPRINRENINPLVYFIEENESCDGNT